MFQQNNNPVHIVTSVTVDHIFHEKTGKVKVVSPALKFIPLNTRRETKAAGTGRSSSNTLWGELSQQALPSGPCKELVWHLQLHLAAKCHDKSEGESEEELLTSVKKLATLLWLSKPLLNQIHGLSAEDANSRPFSLSRDSNLAVRTAEFISAASFRDTEPSRRALHAFGIWAEPVLVSQHDALASQPKDKMVDPARSGSIRSLHLLWLAPTLETLKNLLSPCVAWKHLNRHSAGPGLILDFSKCNTTSRIDDNQSECSMTVRGDDDFEGVEEETTDECSIGQQVQEPHARTLRDIAIAALIHLGDMSVGTRAHSATEDTAMNDFSSVAEEQRHEAECSGGEEDNTTSESPNGEPVNAVDVRMRLTAVPNPSFVSSWSVCYAAIVHRASNCSPESFQKLMIMFLKDKAPVVSEFLEWLHEVDSAEGAE